LTVGCGLNAFSSRVDAAELKPSPVVHYYSGKGVLLTVDGMQSIDEVEADIDRHLPAPTFTRSRNRVKRFGER
jgi:hypothetical protein